MIIKSLSRKSNTGQLVNYIFKYVFREQETSKENREQFKDSRSKFIIRHNIRSRSTKGIIREFNENEKFRLVHRKDSVKIFHTIISFSNKDKENISDKILKDITKKFVEERGHNNLFSGSKHEDKNHIHLHIAVSGTQLNGRSSRISKQKLHSIKLAMDKYQREKYPKELANSLPDHGKGRLQTIKEHYQTNKQALLKGLEKTYTNSKSQEHFLSQLIASGQEPYFRNGSLQGVKFEGKKFRLTRIGFDKAKLHALDQTKIIQDKLSELQKLRASGKSLTRTIMEYGAKRDIPDTLNKNDQKLMAELTEIRNSNDTKEIERDEGIEDTERDRVPEELRSNNENEDEQYNDESIPEEDTSEMEETM